MARELKWPRNGSAQATEEQALGAVRDKIVRNKSVANDIRLNLPVSIQRPDEEERPRVFPFPSGYDSRSEIQRPYIKPPPNKTVCSCGPTNCHSSSTPKSGSSGWGLSGWRNKSPPSSHNRQHSSSSNPSTFSGKLVQKSVVGPTDTSVGVFSNFLAGVITSASDRGAHPCKVNSVKSITQESKPRLKSESSKDYRTSPPSNVNSSMLSGKRTEDTVLICSFDDTPELSTLTSTPTTTTTTTTDEDKNGNEGDRTSDIDPEKSCGDVAEPSSLTEPYYSMNNSSVLSESLQETGPYVLSSKDQYCSDGASSRTKQQ